MDEKFGKFVRKKREEKKINLRKLAEILEIAPAYMSDMEKARRYPRDKEKLAKIAEALELTEDEANTMYDYAALAKDNSVSPDLPEYIMETDNVRVALRKARDLGMGDKDWMDVIKMLEEKEKEAKK
mgnify:FL=1